MRLVHHNIFIVRLFTIIGFFSSGRCFDFVLVVVGLLAVIGASVVCSYLFLWPRDSKQEVTTSISLEAAIPFFKDGLTETWSNLELMTIDESTLDHSKNIFTSPWTGTYNVSRLITIFGYFKHE